MYKKDQWAQFLLLQMLTDVIFHTVCASAPSINKYGPTTKIFQCHQRNTNSYTVFIQRYIYAALELISQKGSFSRKLKPLISVKVVPAILHPFMTVPSRGQENMCGKFGGPFLPTVSLFLPAQ